MSQSELEILMKLLNAQDEPLLHDLLSNRVFDQTDGKDSYTLQGFFLGYCDSEKSMETAL